MIRKPSQLDISLAWQIVESIAVFNAIASTSQSLHLMTITDLGKTLFDFCQSHRGCDW